MSRAIYAVVVQVTPEMIHNWGWFLAFGIVLLLLGVAAVVRSMAAMHLGDEDLSPVGGR